MNESLEDTLNLEQLQQYAILGRETDFEEALQNGDGKISKSGLISVKAGVKEISKGKDKEDTRHGKRKENNRGDKRPRRRNKEHDHLICK